MSYRFAVKLCLLCIAATSASGAIIPSFEITNPGPLNGLPGFVGGVLRITSDQGNITAFDFGGTDPVKPEEALKGIFTITLGNSSHSHVPGLHQRWTASDDGFGNVTVLQSPKGPFASELLSHPGNRDSYFNQDIAATAIVYVAEEDNSLTGSPLSSTNPPAGSPGVFWGLGTSLHYTAGITLAAQAPAIDLAYLVVPSNDIFIHVRGEVAIGTKIPVNWVSWPEPSAALPICFAALGLLTRRRRD